MRTERQAALERAKQGKPAAIEFSSSDDGDLYLFAEAHLSPEAFADAVRAHVLKNVETGFMCMECERSYPTGSERLQECREDGHELSPVTYTGFYL